MRASASKKLPSYALLAVALTAFLFLAAREDGVSRFGRYHDDTVYWNVAGAIATGKGAVVPSLPGNPGLTKYPPLYPYLLSTIWSPLAESNRGISTATWCSIAFTVWGLIVAFIYLRRWRGVGDRLAVAGIALSVLSGPLLILSASVLSDTLFFALAITALMLGDSDRPYAWAGAGIFAGLSVLTRSVGVAVVAGIAINYLIRRRLGRAAGVALLSAPFLAVGAASKLFSAAGPESALPGYLQTWLYYCDYLGFWRASMPDLGTLAGLLKLNLLETLRAPAFLTLGPEPAGPVGMSIWVTITVAIVAGLYRQISQDKARCYHWALLFHLPLVLLWNFEIASRLFLIFLPLFSIGLLTELRHAGAGFAAGMKGGRPMADRIVSVAFLALLAAGATWWTARTARGLIRPSPQGEDYAARYAELIDWLPAHTSAEDRLVAIDDGFLYAYTGRQGMWPLAVTTDLRFHASEERLDEQLSLLPDVARAIGARYLVWTTNDYAFAPPVRDRWETWAREFCEVMTSDGGAVRVYDLNCEADESHRSVTQNLSSL